MVRNGAADAVLVVMLDRLTRSVRDPGELAERDFASGKVALLSVSEQVDTRTASARMVLNIMATISQWERESIGELTAAAMQHRPRQSARSRLRRPAPRSRLATVASRRAREAVRWRARFTGPRGHADGQRR